MSLIDAPEVMKPCAACHKPLPFGKARIMWNPSMGAFRLCKREDGCKTRAKQRLRKLEAAFEEAGGRGVDMAEEIDALRRFVR
jgi:hypothetical protein